MQARKNFSKIKFRIKQDAAMAGLSIDKEGEIDASTMLLARSLF